MLPRLAALALLASASVASAQDVSGFAGTWKLNAQLSQDIAAKIKEVAGSAQMSGGPGWATETWFPWETSFKEGERIGVREFLLATVPAFQNLEIQNSGDEVKTIHGQGGSRIFYLTRASAGTSAMSGETVKRQARLQGGQLLLESKGKEGKLNESLTLEGGSRLAYVVHLEQKRLNDPLDVRLVYDRTE
jgi:hypothetical protein